MNIPLAFDALELWHVAGWTMLHFLWLGTLAAIAAGVCRLVLRRTSANVRYAAALGWLAVVTILPLAVATWLIAKPQAVDPHGRLPHVAMMELNASRAVVPPEPIPEIIGLSPNHSTNARPAPAVAPIPTQPSGLLPLAVFASEHAARHLPWLWLIGTPLTFTLLATGILGAERLRRTSLTIADGPIAEACARLAQTMRIGRRVTIAVCERIAAPVLVGIVRPIILLPPAALTGWSPDEIEMVLLHELAHVRRWDNLVNLLQRLVESLLFFHPAVWLVSHWVRREREACCDAVVVTRTNRPHAYAELLVALAAQMPRSVLFHPAATSAMAAGPLRSRIRRILQLEDDPMLVSGKSLALAMSGLLLAATLVVLNLPTHTQAEESATENTERTQESLDEDVPRATEGLADDLLLENVPFVVGASRFAGGDRITITAVRGSSTKFEPRNTYWIEGTYTLSSRERASLSAFVTARNAGEGRTSINKDQTMIVKRGSGEFTLKLPMPYQGWPHVSFYPAEGGTGFGGVYFGTGDSVLENWSEVYGSDDSRSAESHAKFDLGKFPSLEDQKLADLAWKRLGLELEPIGEDDLKRVRALGFDGGVSVTNVTNEIAQSHQSVQTGDILVGLHVWPTTSLQAVADVLKRDDLAELNPLKFYVVRASLYGDSPQDTIVTGRIAVNVDSSAARPARSRSAVDYSRLVDELVDQRWKADPQAQALREQLVQIQHQLQQLAASNATDEVRRQERQLEVLTKQIEQYRELIKQRMLGEVQRDQFNRRLPGTQQPGQPPESGRAPAASKTLRPPQPPAAPQPAQQNSPTVASTDKSALRYEGRSFRQWRTALQTELSTEKRIEAVNALAAFGASGFGKQAAEAIVEVVGQYDWSNWNAQGDTDTPLKLLLAICVDAFVARHGLVTARIPEAEALPVLLANVDSANPRTRAFLIHVLDEFRYDARVATALVRLSRDEDAFVQRSAFQHLGARWLHQPENISREVVERVREALRSEDTNLQAHAMATLSRDANWGRPPADLYYMPEIIPLLFASDETIRKHARFTIGGINPQQAPELVNQFIEILSDEQSPHFLDAIRILGALRSKAESAIPTLEDILEKSANASRRVAAAHAIDKIEDGARGRNRLLRLINSTDDERERQKLTNLTNAEAHDQ